MEAAQIHQRGGQQIGGTGQGQQLGDAQPAATRKAAVRQKPSIHGAEQTSGQAGAQEQHEGAPQLADTVRAEAGVTVSQSLQSFSH